ncbi:hypothetical protein F2Q70_00019990 [Brassica cretica]|uniref:Uncharacterized protein n=1 Tax=Brassica cretica TaxID=69181 RepID=A0A8S9GMS7_BRACR|nr:hypothetical protein F2Q70_00019990 [Brassica cretica]
MDVTTYKCKSDSANCQTHTQDFRGSVGSQRIRMAKIEKESHPHASQVLKTQSWSLQESKKLHTLCGVEVAVIKQHFLWAAKTTEGKHRSELSLVLSQVEEERWGASRIALHFRNRPRQAFAQHTRTTLSLDWAAQNSATSNPTRWPSQCSTNLSSPHGLQALVIELDSY